MVTLPSQMLENILLAFIPIFVAVDAVGTLPIFVTLTAGVKKADRSRILISSMITAVGLAIAFIFLGRWIFKVLGITMGDFMVAGGIMLFCLAIADIVNSGRHKRTDDLDLGAVPLGTPLIVGPAVLTTSLLMISEYGLIATLVSVVTNILLAGIVFSFSGRLIKVLGEGGSRAVSKVTSLLLAAIAVMLIRKGLEQLMPFFIK